MTCDDIRVRLLREIGGEGDGSETLAHLSTCTPCADYRRDAERVWQRTGRAVERCPSRRSPLELSRRQPFAVAAVAASLIAAASLLAWSARPSPERHLAQDPDAKAEETLKKDPELWKQVLRSALQEKERVAEFEKKLSEAEKGLAEIKALAGAGKIKESVERGESILQSFPHLKIAILDPSPLQQRATVLRLRIRELVLKGQIALLREKPAPGDAAGETERAEVQIRLMNTLREILRQLEELAKGPKPADLGGTDDSLRAATLGKLRSIRVTIDMSDGSLTDVVKYLREISGLNMVLDGPKERREAKLTIQLQDAVLEGMMDLMTKLADYRWEIDRFGIILFTPAKK
jgi:hypothetical protein